MDDFRDVGNSAIAALKIKGFECVFARRMWLSEPELPAALPACRSWLLVMCPTGLWSRWWPETTRTTRPSWGTPRPWWRTRWLASTTCASWAGVDEVSRHTRAYKHTRIWKVLLDLTCGDSQIYITNILNVWSSEVCPWQSWFLTCAYSQNPKLRRHWWSGLLSDVLAIFMMQGYHTRGMASW